MDVLRAISRDAAGGAIVAVVGGLVVWEASHYPLGSLSHMGPGFFPFWLGVILVSLGIVTVVQAIKVGSGTLQSERPAVPSLRSPAAVSASLLAFGLLLSQFGLVPAVVAVALIAPFAERKLRPVTMVVTAVALAAASVAIFIYGFKMPLTPFGWG